MGNCFRRTRRVSAAESLEGWLVHFINKNNLAESVRVCAMARQRVEIKVWSPSHKTVTDRERKKERRPTKETGHAQLSIVEFQEREKRPSPVNHHASSRLLSYYKLFLFWEYNGRRGREREEESKSGEKVFRGWTGDREKGQKYISWIKGARPDCLGRSGVLHL